MISLSRLAWAALVVVAGCTGPVSPTGQPAPTPATAGCDFQVETGPLPQWARAGFSPEARVPYVVGARGDILGVLFGFPLTQPKPSGAFNKILWVSRLPVNPMVPLKIDAHLSNSSTSVSREIAGGPGPSIIDVPQAGCWHLTLSWSGHTDTMDLEYAPGP